MPNQTKENEYLCSRALVFRDEQGKEPECKDCCMTCPTRCDKVCKLIEHFEICPEMISKQKHTFKELFKPKV